MTNEIIEMFISGGKTMAEIAKATGKTRNAVSGIIARARAQGKVPYKERGKAMARKRSKLPFALPDSSGVLFMDREQGQCAFPLWPTHGETPYNEKRCCGMPTSDNASYCHYHIGVSTRKKKVECTTQ